MCSGSILPRPWYYNLYSACSHTANKMQSVTVFYTTPVTHLLTHTFSRLIFHYSVFLFPHPSLSHTNTHRLLTFPHTLHLSVSYIHCLSTVTVHTWTLGHYLLTVYYTHTHTHTKLTISQELGKR